MQLFHQARRSLALVAAGVLLTACPAAARATGLEQTDWQLARYRAETGLTNLAQGGPRAMLRFEDGRVTGSAGCNRLMGSYTLDGDNLSIGPRLASTMMACPPLLLAQEQAVAKALTQVATYDLDDGALALQDAEGAPVLTFTELAALPLAGASWQLTRYNNGKGGVTSLLKGTEVVLMLGGDGHFSGKACNSYRGAYAAEGTAFRIEGPIAATKMLCPEPDGANAQEAAYFAALARAAAYRIQGDELTLSDTEGSTLAEFRAVRRGDPRN